MSDARELPERVDMFHCGPGPYSPTGGNNDGKVRNADGEVIADTVGHEGRAEAIALSLNLADKPSSYIVRRGDQHGARGGAPTLEQAREMAARYPGDTVHPVYIGPAIEPEEGSDG